MKFRGRTSEEAARGLHSTRPDALPLQDDLREAWLRDLAVEATVYGLPAVLQYDLMRRQCTGVGARALTTFVHDRELASPTFSAFRVPNVDTLYSSAWIDLTRGPVDVELPDFGGRYYTLQFLDAFSNTSNLSRRTIGPARRVRILPPGADARLPDGTLAFWVDSPVMWVLMRIQVGQDDLDHVRALQDQVVLIPPDGASRLQLSHAAGDVETEWKSFLATLDAALRLHGHPDQELGLVSRFRPLGVLSDVEFGETEFDPVAARGIERGFREAMALLAASRPLLGTPTPSGWTRVTDKGRHGFNYLSRAIMNFVGLGANVVDENTSFNTYADETGRRLDGRNTYELVIDQPPTTDAFWSITLYEAESGMLFDAPEGRHSVGSASGGRRVAAGGRVTIGQVPDESGATWLPSPPGQFFLTLRIYSPGPDVVSGQWNPPPVRPVAMRD